MNYSDDIITANTALILEKYSVQQRYDFQTQSKQSKSETTASDEMKDCLWNIKKFQFQKTQTEIQKSTALPTGTFSRTMQKLVRKKLVKVIPLPFGRGRPKYPVLLPDGYKEMGIQEKKHKGRGAGYEHTLYQHLIAKHCSDYNSEIEMNRNGKCIDVGIEINDTLIAIEIAMTSVHEKDNIEKDFSLAKADFVIVACLNEKVHQEVIEIIARQAEKIRNKTKAYLIKDLLKTKPEEFINKLQTTLF